MATGEKEGFRLIEKVFIALGAALFCALMALAIIGDHGFITYLELKRNCGKMERRVEALERDNKRLAGEIRALRSNPSTIERIAREELGMIKSGEILYRVKRDEGTLKEPPGGSK